MLNSNPDTPTPCLHFYSTAHLTKETGYTNISTFLHDVPRCNSQQTSQWKHLH